MKIIIDVDKLKEAYAKAASELTEGESIAFSEMMTELIDSLAVEVKSEAIVGLLSHSCEICDHPFLSRCENCEVKIAKAEFVVLTEKLNNYNKASEILISLWHRNCHECPLFEKTGPCYVLRENIWCNDEIVKWALEQAQKQRGMRNE